MPEKKETTAINPYQLESDKRFNPLVRMLAESARKHAKVHQAKHIAKVQAALSSDPSITFDSHIREPNGAGVFDIEEWLNYPDQNPKIVLLLNGLVNPQDIVQISPFLEKYGMAVMRIIYRSREKASEALEAGIGDDSISGYIVRAIKQIQSELLEGKNVEVIVVFNAAKEDLSKVIACGGQDTVLVVGGHGTRGSVSMTDGKLQNTEIPSPKNPLRAFVQHTCAAKKENEAESMGERWASRTYGWERTTSPIDFIDNPLPLRE